MSTIRPRITLGIPDHPRTRALIDKKVAVDGYDLELTYDFVASGERHHRFAQGEFDIGEFSLATYLRTKEKGRKIVALPIFFERGPRQRNIFYREGGLNHPSELRGKKIGCTRYGATAIVWARGFLLDEFGLATTDMQWYVSGSEVFVGRDLPVKVERLEPPAPFGKEKEHLARMVSAGSLEAALVPGDFGYLGIYGGTLPAAMGKFPKVKPLFDNTDEIIRYVKEKGIYPIMHVIAMKQEIAEQHADLPEKLVTAFRAAKDLAPTYMTPEEVQGNEKEKAVVGEDPYAYVLGETERRTIRALNRYQIEQGLMKEELPLESLFVRQALH
jgi:4,5-dihydroxyphthalate decarboxylase